MHTALRAVPIQPCLVQYNQNRHNSVQFSPQIVETAASDYFDLHPENREIRNAVDQKAVLEHLA